jgi:hypothetical protein
MLGAGVHTIPGVTLAAGGCAGIHSLEQKLVDPDELQVVAVVCMHWARSAHRLHGDAYVNVPKRVLALLAPHLGNHLTISIQVPVRIQCANLDRV